LWLQNNEGGSIVLYLKQKNLLRTPFTHLSITTPGIDEAKELRLVPRAGVEPARPAASFGDTETVRDLLSKGADISAKFTQTGKTALMPCKREGLYGYRPIV
jgi:ankyrin repeat protein